MTDTLGVIPWTDAQAAEHWLRAAQGDGLPAPSRLRWQPLRVGIANLWEYDEAEFWFADGRLVLRGGNGAGKTKVLELTTLMLLRGEIAPSVLDPFGSQHRTMRFNLLPTGDGDDPRPPADAGLGYAWVEFGRITETGTAEYFACGLGASARAGTGSTPVTTWHFVTRHRPGHDFRLVAGGRALDLKELKKLDGVAVPPSAADYRARLANELFGLSTDSYDNLTELLKQLRKPKLGERLNPSSLATTLRDALPPLATHEIDQLAEGWEHLEQLRTAMQRTEDAARAIAVFVRTGWRPWAHAVLRNRSDEMASSTTSLDRTTADKKAAEADGLRAGEALEQARELLERAKVALDADDIALRELLESATYKDAVAATGRIEGLRRELDEAQKRQRNAEKTLNRETGATTRAGERLETARGQADSAITQVADATRAVTNAAEEAGLSTAVARYLPNNDITAIFGEHRSRTERFTHLRALFRACAEAERLAERSAQKVELATEATEKARLATEEALTSVRSEAATLDEQIRAWAATTDIVECDEILVGHWCDLIADTAVIDDDGTVPEHLSVIDAMRAHLARTREIWTGRAQDLELARQPLRTRADEVTDLLEQAHARTETAPPAPQSWRRRERPELSAGAGAPLWRLIDPIPGLADRDLAVLEAALAASGLLDAWVSPNGQINWSAAELGVSEVHEGEPSSPNLRSVFMPVAAGGVTAEVIDRVLDRFGWIPGAVPDRSNGGETPGDRSTHSVDIRAGWFTADGRWRMGALSGRAEPTGPAAYLGAAAREATRLRQIAELEAEQAELEQRLTEIDEQLASANDALARLVDEENSLPTAGERSLTAAVVRWAERSHAHRQRTYDLTAADDAHADDLTRRDRARAEFADYASTHRFGLTDLEEQAQALNDFRTHLDSLGAALTRSRLLAEAVTEAERDHRERDEVRVEAESNLTAESDRCHRLEVRLTTAETALGAGHREQLDRKTALEQRLEKLKDDRETYTEQLTDASTAVKLAEQVLHSHEERRAEAERRRDAAMAALWEAIDNGLEAAVEATGPERQNVQSAREFATAIRREVAEGAPAPDADRAWRTCLRKLEDLRQSLLPQQDARIFDEEDNVLPRVEIHSGDVLGFQLPHVAADTLAQRVVEQRDGYDAEQQRVLATLLGSTFIEHLKDRLDYTTRTFAGINVHLAAHPTRQGHAVKVEWSADPSDSDAAAVVDALGRGYGQLSADRQEMVRQFLARRIDRARADAEGSADWKQHLTQALDYRGWLKITLQYRPGATSKWTVFDAAKHGAKSGGEKVVLLSQPLFAAAVVAYDAAAAHAPRMVWLDEAMSGVDTQIKSSFMGLTVDFELDVMLTAHDEWCTYETVPAVAIYDLARERHLPGVDVMPYLWCGGTLTDIDVERIGIAAQETAALTGGLFALDD